MSTPDHTQENIEKLTEYVLGGMDLDTIMGMAKDTIESNYRNDPEMFRQEWAELMDDEG